MKTEGIKRTDTKIGYTYLTFFFDTLPMSHEIRTPINILLGMSEMIERTSSDENVLSYNHNIRMFGNQLQDMVKDILDITRIETGKITLRNEPYSLEELVSGLEVAGKELAREK